MQSLKHLAAASCAVAACWSAVEAQQPPGAPAQDGPRRPRDPLIAKYVEAHMAGDNKAALGYLQQAADAGNADAQSQLAMVYRGDDEDLSPLVARDRAKADALTQAAIAKGSPRAMEDVGLRLMNGADGQKDYAKSFDLFTKADAAGDFKAGRYLGMFYANGYGRPVDNAKAVDFYRRSAEHNDITSQCLLGGMYEQGRGVPKSYDLAVQWYTKSAERGDHIASGGMSALGALYETRTDAKRDLAAARDWYAKAAAQKNVDAAASLKRLDAKGRAPGTPPAELCVSPAHH